VTLIGGLGRRGAAKARTPAAAKGALALSGSNMLRMGVQLAMLPILARLVGPSEYGLVALAVPFVLFCNMLADAGMSQALARRQHVTTELESTVFWLAGGLGLGLSVLACLLAWPLGLLLDQPRLPWLIVALSPILVMSGLTAVSNARVIREGRFGVFAGGDLISTVTSTAVALAAAFNGAGAWSLVAQQLTLWACKFIWVNLNARPRIRAYFRPAEVRDLVRFGLHSIGANLSDFTARNADNMILGGVLGATAVGFYAMAYQIVRVPDLIISGPLFLYVFTAFARAARERAAELALSALRLTSMVLAPVFVGLAFISPPAVRVVLGQEWAAASPVLTHLTLAGFGFATCLVCGAIMMGLGRSQIQLRMALTSAVTTITLIALFARQGVETASLAVALGVAAVTVAYLSVLAHDLEIPLRRLAGAFAPAAVGAAALAGALALAGPPLSLLPDLSRLAAMIGLGAVVYSAVAATLGHRQFRQDLRAFSEVHGQRAHQPL
jgi:O-antigen/teichoic acid export membrane protein